MLTKPQYNTHHGSIFSSGIRRLIKSASIYAIAIALAAQSHLGSQNAIAAEVLDPEKLFFDKGKTSSLPRLSLTARMIRQLDVAAQYRYNPGWKTDPLKRMSLDTIFEQYQHRVRQEALDDAFYDAAGWALKKTMSVGQSAIGGNGTLLNLAKDMAGKSSAASLDKGIQELKSHGHRNTEDWLATALRQSAELGAIDDLSSIAPLSPEEKRKWLADNKFVDDLLKHADDVKKEDRPIVEGMLIHALDKHIKAGLDLSAQVDSEQNAKLADQAKQVAAVAKSFAQFQKDTDTELTDIRQKQEEISSKVDELQKRTDKNSADIEFLQSFMFEKMNPTEQLAALRNGLLPSLSETERAKKIAQIEIIKKRQELSAAVTKFGQGAASLANIAKHLNVDPNVVDTMNKAAQIANVGQTVLAGVTAGGLGYLSAAEAVTGFAFGGDDGGARRHAEIMAALGEIKQGISEIQEMLVAIGDQLDQIQKNQQTMMEALQEVSQQIDKNHIREMEELAKIRTDLVPIAAMLNEILFKDINACAVFEQRLKGDGFSWTSPISFHDLTERYEEYGNQCLEGFKDTMSNPFALGTYFLDRFKGVPNSPADVFISKTYRTSADLALENTPDVRETVESFQRPVQTLSALELKQNDLRNSPASAKTQLSQRSKFEISQLLTDPIAAQILIKHADWLSNLHPFFELRAALKSGSEDDLLNQKSGSDEGYQLLRTVRDYIDLAITQQVMLSGDTLLPVYMKLWNEGAGNKKDGETDEAFGNRKRKRHELEKAMETNDALAKNFLLLLVSTQVREHGNIIQYAFNYEIPGDPSFMHKILPQDQFTLQPSAAGKPTEWLITIGSKAYKLPTPSELAEGKLTHSPEVHRLLSARNKIQEQMTTYPEFSRYSVSDWQLIREAVWTTAEAEE